MTLDQITKEVTIGFDAVVLSKYGSKEFSLTKNLPVGDLVVTMSQSRDRDRYGSYTFKVKTQLKLNRKVIAKKDLLLALGETSKVRENPIIKAAFMARAPQLTADWIEFVRVQFANVAAANNGVVLVSPDPYSRFYKLTRYLLADVCAQVKPLDSRDWKLTTYILDEDRLVAAGKAYGEDAALDWFRKTNEKLGDVSDMEMGKPGGNMEVIAARDGKKIVLDQQRILKTSIHGKLFHQYPARIYVDGKFYPEAAYKKMFAA